MNIFDVSVIVTAHDESVVAGLTMKSAEQAITLAEGSGISVERIIGLDAATPECRAFFMQPAFDGWRRIDVENHDLGLSRNELVKEANGKFVAFLDADDLYSENWLFEGFKRLSDCAREGRRVIVHPELNWLFDAGNFVFTKPGQSDPFFTPYYFATGNYYDALCMAPRHAFIEVPYAGRDRKNGFGYEDWLWNIDTIKAGWRHEIVRDTIIFKRRRDVSMLVDLRQSGTVLWDSDALFVDRIRDFGRLFAVPESAASDAN